MSARRSIWFGHGVLAAIYLVLAGCSTPHIKSGEFESLQRMNSRQPYPLYLLASPHPRLYVEVDAVEGCVPSDADLGALRQFLAACCDKPDGVELVRSDVIPRKAARGIPPEALARKYLDGPPEGQGPGPAFLHVLCYDNPLSTAPAVWETGHPALRQRAATAERAPNPRVNLLLPTMILMNMRYANRDEVAEMLRHEAGHVLGLGNRTASAAYGHCLDPACLMYSTFPGPVTRFFSCKGCLEPRKLCPQCLAQLAQASKSDAAPGLRFVGPVLVRQEPGYHVLALVGRTKVIIGELSEQDCRDFAAGTRAETPVKSGGAGWRADCFAKSEATRDAVKLAETLHQAEADPYPPVREVVARAWDNIIQAYRDHGEDKNAQTLCSLRAASQQPAGNEVRP
jgi:hypothetical protein